jgi:hypothetical protein
MKEFIDEYLDKIKTAMQEQFREDLLLEFEGCFRRALETHEIPEDIEIRFTLENEVGFYYKSMQVLEDDHKESDLWDSFQDDIQLSQFHDNPILYSLMLDFIYKNGEFEWGVNDFSEFNF